MLQGRLTGKCKGRLKGRWKVSEKVDEKVGEKCHGQLDPSSTHVCMAIATKNIQKDPKI